MLCSISGESPQDPVISSKSGNVFERRLIEAYIATNGTDPVTSEALTLDDLIPVRTSRIPRPRPPTLTSIPSLLSVFQNEWDAFALDAYTLRQQLSQTRQELATALYQQDAAVRVIARLTRERDEARDALSKVSVGAAPAGDAMQVDTAGLPEDLLEKVDAKHEELSKSRRKRAVPAGWATQDDIQRFGVAQTSETVCPHASFVAVDAAGERALVGGRDGVAGVFDVKENKLVQELAVGGGSVTDGVFFGAQPVVATSSGAVKVFEGAKEVVSFTSHAGSANAVALHPTGDILASVGVDKSFVVYDLVSRKAVAQVYTELDLSTCAFHPDGHLLALASPGLISLYHFRTLTFAASFPLPTPSPISSLSFSENGIWFAAASGSTVTIFDLRKEGAAAVLKEFGSAAEISDVQFDYTGAFLAWTGGAGTEVWAYRKKEKSWTEGVRSAVNGVGLGWGGEARGLVVVKEEGVVVVLGKEAE